MRAARFSWFLPAIPLSFIHYMPTWYWAFGLGIVSAAVASLAWKLVTFAVFAKCLFGDHIVKCKNCGTVSHPGASPVLIEILSSMQEKCQCSKEVGCSSSHGS